MRAKGTGKPVRVSIPVMTNLYALLTLGTLYALLILGVIAAGRWFSPAPGAQTQPRVEPGPSTEGEAPTFFSRVLALLAALKCFLVAIKTIGFVVIWITDSK